MSDGAPMTILSVLTETRQVLDSQERWVSGYMAVDAVGLEILPIAPAACRWCVAGAIQKAIGTNSPEHVYFRDVINFLDTLARRLHGPVMYTVRVNDEKGYPAIIELLDQAIVLQDKLEKA